MFDRSNELDAWDRDHLFHPVTHMAQHARGESPNRIIVGGEGVYVIDHRGQRSLDAFAGLFSVNVGYGRREIADAIAAQAGTLAYFHSYAGHGNEPSIRLAKMMIERAPPGMSRVFFGLSGSDANETAVKLAWYCNNVLGRPAKKKIIARRLGYHGSGFMSGSLTGIQRYHTAVDLPLERVIRTEAPYFFRREDRTQDEEEFSQYCADQLERLIEAEGADTIAAFIGEPLMGTGGIVPPPKGYWDRIQAVLARHDIMLLVDEVITGFGRLGTMFGSTHYGIRPDLISVAKGLTSAYAPLSGVIISEKTWKILEAGSEMFGPLGHGWTYSAHPVCAAAGLANLELLDRMDLVRNAARVGAHFRDALTNVLAGHPIVGEVRGAGLVAGIEFVKDKNARIYFDAAQKVSTRIAAALLKRGVIGRAMPHGDVLGFAPPLCLTAGEADIIVTAARDAVEEVAAEL